MKGTMTTLHAGGGETRHELDRAATLDELQAAVGGYIESVAGFETYEGQPAWVIVNEEGKLKGLQPNERATKLWEAQTGVVGWDVLMGDVVILQGDAEFMAAL